MKTLYESDNEKQALYFRSEPHKNGIACDICGEELVDSEPNVILYIWPPQTKVHCEKCGFKGYRFL